MWRLLGPLLVNGVGLGLFIVPAFDTIISAVTDAETGSAAGVLNAIQQLASMSSWPGRYLKLYPIEVAAEVPDRHRLPALA